MAQPTLFETPNSKELPLTSSCATPVGSGVLAVDGNSVVHRAWWAYRNSQMHTPTGIPVFAAHGFLLALSNILLTCTDATGHQFAHLVVGFDDPESNRRAECWSFYKAQRGEHDPDIARQMAFIRDQLCPELGILAVTSEGWEADDVCATAAARAADGCVVASSDRDFYGLIDTDVIFARLGNKSAVDLVDETAFQTQFGFPAGRYTQYAAMRGDSSDNIAGVRGIGEKTAGAIVAVGDVEDILTQPGNYRDVLTKNALAKLQAGSGDYRQAVEIMACKRDLAVNLDQGCVGDLEESTVMRGCRRWGLHTSGKRLAGALGFDHRSGF